MRVVKFQLKVAEWLKLMSTQANVICEESPKKTISPEHVIEALRVSDHMLRVIGRLTWLSN